MKHYLFDDYKIKGCSAYIGGHRVSRSCLAIVCGLLYDSLKRYLDYDKYSIAPKPFFSALSYKSLVSAFARLLEDYCHLFDIYVDTSILVYSGKPFKSFLIVNASKVNKTFDVQTCYDRLGNVIGYHYNNSFFVTIVDLKNSLSSDYPEDRFNIIIRFI